AASAERAAGAEAWPAGPEGRRRGRQGRRVRRGSRGRRGRPAGPDDGGRAREQGDTPTILVDSPDTDRQRSISGEATCVSGRSGGTRVRSSCMPPRRTGRGRYRGNRRACRGAPAWVWARGASTAASARPATPVVGTDQTTV